MIVVAKQPVEPHYRFLTGGKEYIVIGLSHQSFRVIDDKGEPILFPRSCFIVIDEHIPSDWVWKRYSDDEFYANPPELHTPGFYEDYFDRRDSAIKQFEAFLERTGIKRVH